MGQPRRSRNLSTGQRLSKSPVMAASVTLKLEVQGWPNNQIKLRPSLNQEARKTKKLRVQRPS